MGVPRTRIPVGHGDCLPCEVRRQRMIAGLIEEGRFFGGGFQKLLVLRVDVVAELHRLVLGHPRRQIDPGHRNLLGQSNVLALAGILYALLHASASLRLESAQLQAKADATMTQMVGKALAEGDYGEVQAELASFAALKYFESALVVNKRGRVIAATGPIHGIRMGDPLAAGVAGNARVVELNDNAGRIGQLLVWHSAAQDETGAGGKWLAGTAMLVVVGAAATAALLLQRRQRRASAHR